MRTLNGIMATIALVLSSAALAGMVYTDQYSHAARIEARGFDALNHALLACADDAALQTLSAADVEPVQQ